MAPSYRDYTLAVNKGDTLEKIAKAKSISLDELLGANPNLLATQKLEQGQLIYLPVIQHMLEERATKGSENGSAAVPETFDEQKVNGYKGRLHEFFEIVDDDENGYLDIREFKSLLNYLNIRSLSDSEIIEIYRDMKKMANNELTFDGVYQYVYNIIFIRDNLNQCQLRLFDAMLTADHMNQCQLGGITQFLNKTWAKFSQYRRYGNNGELVMSAGDNIAVVKEGTHSLIDLVRWNDGLTTIEPKHAIVKGFRWRSKSELGPDAKSGELIFPTQFDRNLPTEMATSQTLSYYGCCFANETQLKISLLHQHEIEDFKYHPEYFSGFVESINHPGLERHGFAHLDCPHGDYKDNGRFILGKIVNGDELHLTAFQIPSRHTLYIPPNTIHSNDYLCGTWRTMLAVAEIDRVVLKRKRADGNLEIFAFDFP